MKTHAIWIAAFAAATLFTRQVEAQSTTLHVGCMDLTVSDSWTAQVFHIVDQLSGWDPYIHKQYVRWAAKSLPLDSVDQHALGQHAALRRARGWGKGFEPAFLVDGSIDDAAKRAIDQGTLTPEEAGVEKAVLLHFSAKLSKLQKPGEEQIAALVVRLRSEARNITPLVGQLCSFAEAPSRVAVPVFLVTNPEEGSGGGEANGNRIVVEVQRDPDPLPILLHESLHALLRPHEDSIKAIAERSGLTFVTLNEGIAYALAPGMTDDPNSSDRLINEWARALMRGRPTSDSFVQIYMLAAVIRPLLRSSLRSGETFSIFLPKAVQAWKAAIK